jgi:hypothetical protein
MKLNIFVALAFLTFSSSLVLAVPIDSDWQELAAREAYDIDDFFARDFADLDELDLEAREEIPSVELDAREFLDEDIFARVCL